MKIWVVVLMACVTCWAQDKVIFNPFPPGSGLELVPPGPTGPTGPTGAAGATGGAGTAVLQSGAVTGSCATDTNQTYYWTNASGASYAIPTTQTTGCTIILQNNDGSNALTVSNSGAQTVNGQTSGVSIAACSTPTTGCPTKRLTWDAVHSVWIFGNPNGAPGPTGPQGANGTVYCADASGSGTAYTCTPSPAVASYATGLLVTFIPQTTSSGASTVNISGLGAKSIVWTDGATAMTTADILAAGVYTLEYDGTYFRNINGPDGPWIGLAYSNSWVNLGGGLTNGQYRKLRNGTVCVEGFAGSGTSTSGTVVFTLPAGYRPPTIAFIPGQTDATSTISIVGLAYHTDGTVVFVETQTAGYISFGNSCFSEF